MNQITHPLTPLYLLVGILDIIVGIYCMRKRPAHGSTFLGLLLFASFLNVRRVWGQTLRTRLLFSQPFDVLSNMAYPAFAILIHIPYVGYFT